MGAFARWRALDPQAQRLAVSSAWTLMIAVAALRVLSLRRALAIAARPVRGAALDSGEIARRIRAMDRAGRYVPGAACLAKSVALASMLRRRGMAAEVRIGVRAEHGFAAHAWVECGGVALTEPALAADRFVTAC